MTNTFSGGQEKGSGVVSTGVHTEGIEAYLGRAPYAQQFTPLLADARIIPESMRAARLIPAILYGIHGFRPQTEKAELLGGDSALVSSVPKGIDYFNPHKELREEARALAIGLQGKGKKRIKGKTYGLPAYVVDCRQGLYLFVGGADSDHDDLKPELPAAIARSYKIGNIVLGGEIVYGDHVPFGIGRTSLPRLIREIGQHISRLSGSYQVKVEALKYAKKMLESNNPTDYSRFS